ncbi:MAG: hypothetical protein CVV45_11700 [Spirochaetae bacterium HGW-Spirochaetae-10]|nr:MAG: hypothetical protein CVV45_11700 [Spirochaetae bacterium HGW-Spirochaetae-10]
MENKQGAIKMKNNCFALAMLLCLLGCDPKSGNTRVDPSTKEPPIGTSDAIGLAGQAVYTDARKLNAFNWGIKDSEMTHLGRLTDLEELHLTLNPISDLRPLSGLRKLRYLGLAETKVRDLRPLKDLPNLTTIELFSLPDYNSIDLEILPSTIRILRVSDNFPQPKLADFKRNRAHCTIEVWDHKGGKWEYQLSEEE